MQSNFVNSAISSTNLFKQILHMYMYAELFNVLNFFNAEYQFKNTMGFKGPESENIIINVHKK